jgi:hypothetical protein
MQIEVVAPRLLAVIVLLLLHRRGVQQLPGEIVRALQRGAVLRTVAEGVAQVVRGAADGTAPPFELGVGSIEQGLRPPREELDERNAGVRVVPACPSGVLVGHDRPEGRDEARRRHWIEGRGRHAGNGSGRLIDFIDVDARREIFRHR